MIKYEMDEYVSVLVDSDDDFTVDLEGHSTHFNRDELERLRSIIDMALNTSAEELKASEAERERQRYAKVDPERQIENAFVSADEACGIRDASKALDA